MSRMRWWMVTGGVAAAALVAALSFSATGAEARRPPRTATATATPWGPRLVPPSPTPTSTATSSTDTIATGTTPSDPAPVLSLPLLPAMRMNDTFETFPLGVDWADGTTHESWMSRFNGYGSVGIATDGDKVLALSPKASTSAGETHAALVTSTVGFVDVDFTVDASTVKQLRTGSAPNTWETAWVLWNYTDNTHFYYVALKTNGWEIGKEDPAYPGAQRFLVTGTDRVFPAGGWHTVHVKQTGTSFTVSVDGRTLATFTDTERPYTSGQIGLYTEDAVVHFNNVNVAP